MYLLILYSLCVSHSVYTPGSKNFHPSLTRCKSFPRCARARSFAFSLSIWQCKNLQGPGVICISWRRMFRSESHTNRTLARITPALGACLVYICGNGNSSTLELWLTDSLRGSTRFPISSAFYVYLTCRRRYCAGLLNLLLIYGEFIFCCAPLCAARVERRIFAGVLERKLQESLNLQIGAEIEWRTS